jgi:hypothetical protein
MSDIGFAKGGLVNRDSNQFREFLMGLSEEGRFEFDSKPDKPVDPAAIVGEQDPWDGLADQPPPISGYREADVAGIACWNCAHFTPIGDNDNDGVIDGACCLFEAKADGNYTCDRFTAHADLLRQGPHTEWQEDMANMQQDAMGPSVMESEYSDSSILSRLNFASEATEEDGLVWKDILRTGVWTHTPLGGRVVKKPLQIRRDGESDPVNGVISLAELYENFNDGAIPYVTVPLSDDEKDHKNIARLNTGFVRKLKLEDRDGVSVLRAGIDFTEPDVKGKVLRGTIPDVSAGVPFNVTRRSDNRHFNTVLDHVCLTRKPFVDKLTPFGIAAADGEELPVEAYEQEASESEPTPAPPESSPPPPSEQENETVQLTFRQYEAAIRKALADQLRLSPEYKVEDVGNNVAIIVHAASHSKWEVPFRMTDNREAPLALAGIENWKLLEEEQQEAPAETTRSLTATDALRQARELRELRLSQPTSQPGGIQMSDLMTLDGVELSDIPEEARARIQNIINENADLRRTSQTGKVNERIEELKSIEGLNFADRPGALKLYRQVMLSDDGGPAIVLFSDGDEDKKERLTALEILDRFIEGLKAGEGAAEFSDQHFASGNDRKPAKDASGEGRPLEERVEDSKKALYGDKNKRRTGRK